MTIFQKQDAVRNKMIEDYFNGIIPSAQTFKPYFDWKCGFKPLNSISRPIAHKMIEMASQQLETLFMKHSETFAHVGTDQDDPWQHFRGYADDCYQASHYALIEDELTNLLVGGFFI